MDTLRRFTLPAFLFQSDNNPNLHPQLIAVSSISGTPPTRLSKVRNCLPISLEAIMSGFTFVLPPGMWRNNADPQILIAGDVAPVFPILT